MMKTHLVPIIRSIITNFDNVVCDIRATVIKRWTPCKIDTVLSCSRVHNGTAGWSGFIDDDDINVCGVFAVIVLSGNMIESTVISHGLLNE